MVSTTTLRVDFVSESADYHNVFGWYNSVTGQGGILFADVEAGGSHAPLTPEVSNVNFTVNTADLGSIHYFLIADGFDLNSSNDLRGPIKVVQLFDGSWAVARADESGDVIMKNGKPDILEGRGADAFFTEKSKNEGGTDHASSTVGTGQTPSTLAGDIADGATGLIAWEDVAATKKSNGTWTAPGDGDYNDSVFRVTVVNGRPDAKNDSITIGEDAGATTLDVLANDIDPNGDTLKVTAVNGSGVLGTLSIAAGGTGIVFTPGSAYQYLSAGQSKTETFSYTISDGHGGTDTANVTLKITGANDSPIVGTAVLSGSATEKADRAPGENSTTHQVTGTIAFADPDAKDHHQVSVRATGAGYHGTLNASVVDEDPGKVKWTFKVADASIDYLAAGQTLTQTYEVTISDGEGGSVVRNVAITITGTNDAPMIGKADTSGTVTERPENAADENIKIHQVSGDIGFTDVDLSDTHAVTVTPQSSGYLGTLTASVANDSTGDGAGRVAWQFTVADSAIDGLAAGQTLIQTYKVKIDDGHGGFDEETVTIKIKGAADTLSTAPQTNNVSATGNEDTTITVALAGSDSDGTITSFKIVSLPANGTLYKDAALTQEVAVNDTVTASGNAATVYFKPAADWNGSTSFQYASLDNDGVQDATPATSSITVHPVNDGPQTADTSAAGDEDTAIAVPLSGSDIDGTVASFKIASLPVNGTLYKDAALTEEVAVNDTVPASGNAAAVYFKPAADWNGSTSFQYAALDDGGVQDATPATGSIIVNPVNDAPVAQDDSASGDEDTLITGQVVATDVDNTTLTYALVSDAVDGNGDPVAGLVFNSDGSYSFQGPPDFNGPVSFTYKANDGALDGNVATVSITVNPVNDAPLAAADAFTTDEDTAIGGNVFADNGNGGDFDPEGSALTVTEVNGVAANVGSQITLASGALLTVNADGTFSYDPNGAFEDLNDTESDTDTFQYTVSDGAGGFSSASVTINIDGVSDVFPPPIPDGQVWVFDENQDLLAIYSTSPGVAPPGVAYIVNATPINAAVEGIYAGVDHTVVAGAGDYTTGGQPIDVEYDGMKVYGNQWGVDPRDAAGLRMPGSGDESIVNGTGGTQVFRIRADNVELNGFEIYNSTADLVTTDGIGGNGGDSGAIIRYNIARDAGDDALVLFKHTGGVIEYNRVFAGAEDGINVAGNDTITASPVSQGNTVQFNEVSGGFGNGGIYVFDSVNTLITGNYVHDYAGDSGIVLGLRRAEGNPARDGGVISNNIVSGSGENGIDVFQSDVLVSGNTVTGNNGWGISIGIDYNNESRATPKPDNVVVQDNVFENNNLLKNVPVTTAPGSTPAAGPVRVVNGATNISFVDNDLIGNNGGNLIGSTNGDDQIDGLGGSDTVTYAAAAAAVTVNLLSQGTPQNTGAAGTDTLLNIENLVGSAFADTLSGDGGSNVIEGRAGDDTLDGDGGSDTASYENATAGVTVSLLLQGTPQNTGGAGTDTLSNFENILGSASADILIGDGGANILSGLAGNDRLVGGDGADVLIGGAGVDTIDYSESALPVTVNLTTDINTGGEADGDVTASNDLENIIGSAGSDSLTGDGLANVLTGGAGADSLDGGSGADTASYAGSAAVNISLMTGFADGGDATGDILVFIENLIGSSNNDTLEGDAGNNVLDGALGSDTLSYANALGAVTVSLAVATAQNTGGAGIDTLLNFESLTGSSFADSLTGNGAANILDGGVGADSLTGGAGNDTYIVDDSGDSIVESTGIDSVLSSASTFTLATNVENLTLTGTGNINGIGNTLANVITGNSGDNTLDGGTGSDTLIGGGGNDTYVANVNTDIVTELAGEGTDVVQFTSATANSTFTLGANVENLILSGTANINGTGNAESNLITGNGGNNTLNGMGEADTLIGNNGADVLIGGTGNDVLDLTETAAAIDQIRYSETGSVNVDTVGGFSVAGKDAFGLTAGTIAEAGFGSPVTLSRGNGADAGATAAGAVVVVSIAQNVDAANVSTAHAVKFTTAATSFANAIGSGSFAISDSGFGSTEAMLAVWFDSSTNQAVFGTLRNSSTAAANELQAGDTFAEAARVSMSLADYVNLNTDNFLLFS